MIVFMNTLGTVMTSVSLIPTKSGGSLILFHISSPSITVLYGAYMDGTQNTLAL